MAWKLMHPDSDQVVEAEAEAVAMYLSQGWETVSGRVPDEATPSEAPAPKKTSKSS